MEKGFYSEFELRHYTLLPFLGVGARGRKKHYEYFSLYFPKEMFHYKISNFAYVESLYRGLEFLVVFIQIAPVHSKFDIELC